MATRTICDYTDDDGEGEHVATFRVRGRTKEDVTVSTFVQKDTCLWHIGSATKEVTEEVMGLPNFYDVTIEPY